MAGGTFKPCLKCDYLFNHTSGKVSGGKEGEALCLKKTKYGNSVKAVISQCRFVAAFFMFPVSVPETGRREMWNHYGMLKGQWSVK